MDPTFNLILLALDAAALLCVVFRLRRVLSVVAAGLLAATGLVGWFQTDPFHLMRLCSYVLFLHGPLVLLACAGVLRRRTGRVAAVCAAGALLLLVVGVDAFVVEPRWLEITRLTLESPKLSRPVRIAVISDLQTDRLGAYERDVLLRVEQERPDLILMLGDYIHERDSRRRRRLIKDLATLLSEIRFQAPLGVYAVRGNVDGPEWTWAFDGRTRIPVERTSAFRAGELRLTALGLSDSFDAGLELPASERFHVVFGHAPEFALGRIEADLLLAGHTHGGQVRLPFIGPLITFSKVPRNWAAGVTALDGDRTLVVSRGVGMERGLAPRMRFLCRPELVVIDLLPAAAAHGLAWNSGR